MLAAILALSAAAAAAEYAPPLTGDVERREYVCMMQDMVMLRKGIPLTSGGKKYWGCCDMCKAKIEAEPERYTKAVDPVSGKRVDKAAARIYALDGLVYYFESVKTRAAFSASPAKYLPARGP